MASDADIKKKLEEKLEPIKTFVEETLADESYTSSQTPETLEKITGKDIENVGSNILLIFLQSLNELFQGKFTEATGLEYKATTDYLAAHKSGTPTNEFNTAAGNTDQTPQNATIIDDRFFPAEVYKQLANQGYVEGKYLGHPGENLNRAYVAKLAIEKLEQKAEDLGIEKNEITKAMFEGKFNPYHEDMELAFKGISEYKDVTPEDVPDSLRNFLIQIDYMKPEDKIPREEDLAAVLAQKRQEAWNERFGSIADIEGKINTFANGQEVELSTKDIALRMHMRLHLRDFEKTFEGVLERDPNLTYDKAMQALQTHPDLATKLDLAVEKQMKISAPEYFDYESGHGFNLKEDYQNLRYNRYIPALKEDSTSALSPQDKREEIKETKNEVTGQKPPEEKTDNTIKPENAAEQDLTTKPATTGVTQ